MPAILWLCRDFRLDDNAALAAACADGPVLPVFILDAATRAQGSASRWRLGHALAAFDTAWLERTGEHITVLEGEAAELLPDPAANAMNWQWVAGCGPDAAPFFRIFNPEKQAASFDPDSHYRDHWLHGAGARAYAATLPASWNTPTGRVGADSAPLLADGRARALAALAAFNREG